MLCINPNSISLLSAAIATALSNSLTTDELNVYGNLITAIGAQMLTIAAVQQAGGNESGKTDAVTGNNIPK